MVSYLASPDGLWRARGRDPLSPLGDAGYVPGWGFPTWRDEFDGETVDTDKWEVRDNTYLSYDWGNIRAANATIVDNQLRLRISQRGTPTSAGDRTRWWDTAYLTTIGKMEQRYGRWEARMKIPTIAGLSKGVWPAFWLRNGSVGEIDIMESWGDPPDRARSSSLTETSTFTMHESTNGGANKQGWTIEQRVPPQSPPFSTAQGFHTWALEMTPTYIRCLFDGYTAVEVTPATHPWAFGSTFNSPWNIRLNAQMGDPYWTQEPVPNAQTQMPADFLIDYVRYYALPA